MEEKKFTWREVVHHSQVGNTRHLLEFDQLTKVLVQGTISKILKIIGTTFIHISKFSILKFR